MGLENNTNTHCNKNGRGNWRQRGMAIIMPRGLFFTLLFLAQSSALDDAPPDLNDRLLYVAKDAADISDKNFAAVRVRGAGLEYIKASLPHAIEATGHVFSAANEIAKTTALALDTTLSAEDAVGFVFAPTGLADKVLSSQEKYGNVPFQNTAEAARDVIGLIGTSLVGAGGAIIVAGAVFPPAAPAVPVGVELVAAGGKMSLVGVAFHTAAVTAEISNFIERENTRAAGAAAWANDVADVVRDTMDTDAPMSPYIFLPVDDFFRDYTPPGGAPMRMDTDTLNDGLGDIVGSRTTYDGECTEQSPDDTDSTPEPEPEPKTEEPETEKPPPKRPSSLKHEWGSDVHIGSPQPGATNEQKVAFATCIAAAAGTTAIPVVAWIVGPAAAIGCGFIPGAPDVIGLFRTSW